MEEAKNDKISCLCVFYFCWNEMTVIFKYEATSRFHNNLYGISTSLIYIQNKNYKYFLLLSKLLFINPCSLYLLLPC